MILEYETLHSFPHPTQSAKWFAVLSVMGSMISFETGLKKLNERDFSIISAEERARVNLYTNTKNPLSVQGSWIGECIVGLPKKGILIVDKTYNPILVNPTAAATAHKTGNEFYLGELTAKALEERAEADAEKAIKSGVLFVPKKELKRKFEIDALVDEAILQFHWRQNTSQIRDYLRQNLKEYDKPIESIGYFTFTQEKIDTEYKPFAKELWLGGLASGFSFACYDFRTKLIARGFREEPLKKAQIEFCSFK